MAAAAGVRRAATGDTARSHPPQEQNPGQRVTRSQSRRAVALQQVCQGPRSGAVSGRHRQPAGCVGKTKPIGHNSMRERRHLRTAIKNSATNQIKKVGLIVGEDGTGQHPHASTHLHQPPQQASPQPAPAALAPPLFSGQSENDSANLHQAQQAVPQPGPAGLAPPPLNVEPLLGPDILGACLRNSWHRLQWRAIGCIGYGALIRNPAHGHANLHHPPQQVAFQPAPAGLAPPLHNGQPAHDQAHLHDAPQQAAPQPAPAGSAAPPLNIQDVINDVANIASRTVTMSAYIAAKVELVPSSPGSRLIQRRIRNFLVLTYPKDLPSFWSELVTDKMVNSFRDSGVRISSLIGTVYVVELYIHRNPLRQRSM